MSVTWEEFVAAHASIILRSALRVLAANADAEDVAQEVFVEVFRSGQLARLHDQPALLRTMATRRALDRLRRRKRNEALTGLEVSRGDHEPHQYSLADELDQRLRESLACLPSREAEVFCLTYFENLAPAEIASTLRISTGAVAKSLCMARGRLSAALLAPDAKVTR